MEKSKILHQLSSSSFNSQRACRGQSPFVGQAVFVFPKRGQTIIYISLVSENLFIVIAKHKRTSDYIIMSNCLKLIVEKAYSAFTNRVKLNS